MRSLLIVLLCLGAACSEKRVVDVPADLVAEPRQLDFGPVFVGEAAQRRLRIENRSRSAAEVSLVARGAFSVDPVALRLEAGASTEIVVAFQPAAEGEDSATITAVAGSTRFEIPLRGMGTLHALDAPAVLEFGPTVVGRQMRKSIEVTNRAAAVQSVRLTVEGDNRDLFGSTDLVNLAPGETHEISVEYRPSQRGKHAASLRLDVCRDCEPIRITLRGEGYEEAIGVVPSVWDAGTVLVGATVQKSFRLENRAAVPVTVLSAELAVPANAPFSAELPPLGTTIDAHQSVEIRVTFAPTASGVHEATMRFQVGSAVAEVPITARASDAALLATPAALDLGAAEVNSPRFGTVVIDSNDSSLQITRVAIEGDRTFSLQPAPPLPVSMEGGPLSVRVGFQASVPGIGSAELVVESDLPGVEVRVPLFGAAVSTAPCSLVVAPESLQFGLTEVGSSSQRSVVLRNVAQTACHLWKLALPAGGPFSLVSEPTGLITMEAGETLALELEYAPTSVGFDFDRATMEIYASPPGVPPLEVPLSGYPIGFPLSATPSPLFFGEVPTGVRRLASVRVENGGAARLELMRAVVDGPAAFSRVSPALPRTLPGGSSETHVVAFEPDREGEVHGTIAFHFRDLPAPLVVELRGEGSNVPCTGACLGPQVVCPAPQTVRTHALTRLEGSATPSDSSCLWSVGAAPAGAAATPLATGPCESTFRPDLVGDWTLVMTATDDEGRASTCSTVIHAEPLPPFYVETTWSGADDIDLHLFHPAAGSPTDPAAWFTVPWDCFFSNSSPDWDVPGREDDPVLERDDRTGRGPEQIRISRPSTAHPYRLGVHWFDSSYANLEQTVTTRIYCGGTLAAEVSTTLEAMDRAAYIGEVLFTGPDTCRFTPDGTRLWLTP